MIVNHIWDAEYPWDVRVEKLSRELAVRGHQVHILARNRNARPAHEILPEGTVHRLAWWRATGAGLNSLSQFPAFFNPRWIRFIDRTVRSTRANVVLCRDLPLAPSAVYVARSHAIPMVLDMAENYPAMIADLWRWGQPGPFDGLVRNPVFARWVERWVVRRADHILVVVEESRRRVMDLGVPGERVSIVSNTPPKANLVRAPSHRAPGSALEVVYVGQLDSAMRGVGVLLQALSRCRSGGHGVKLTVIGDGLERQSLERQARALACPDGVVTFTGRLPHAEAVALLPRFHVGVVPHLATDHSHTTVANKLFDYMAAGLAVVVTNARPLARIVTESGCGEVAVSGDADSMAHALDLLTNEEYRARCAAAGCGAIGSTYHWEQDAARLWSALERTTGLAHQRSAA